MHIRPALATEAGNLATLGERLWRETYMGLVPSANLDLHLADTFGSGRQAKELADPACHTLVIEDEGSLLGYALLRARGLEEGQALGPFVRPLEVCRFYVDRDRHGTGAAHDLMAAVVSCAIAGGHDALWLQVWEQNARAIRFYAKAGFADAGETTFQVGAQVDRDRVMVRVLDAQAAPVIKP